MKRVKYGYLNIWCGSIAQSKKYFFPLLFHVREKLNGKKIYLGHYATCLMDHSVVVFVDNNRIICISMQENLSSRDGNSKGPDQPAHLSCRAV